MNSSLVHMIFILIKSKSYHHLLKDFPVVSGLCKYKSKELYPSHTKYIHNQFFQRLLSNTQRPVTTSRYHEFNGFCYQFKQHMVPEWQLL